MVEINDVFREVQLRREYDHNRIINDADFLSKVFTTLFPTTIDSKKAILRLKVFSKIASYGFVDLSDKKRINQQNEFESFINRSTKKKILDSLSNAGLIKKAHDDFYESTQAGEAAWQSVLQFLDNYKKVEDEVIEEGGKVYEYILREISVDDEGNCKTITNTGLKNLGNKWIKFLEPTMWSDKEKYKGIFRIKHSENIKDYEVLVDEDMLKKVKINFEKPLKKNEFIDLWYEYSWLNQYPPKERDWQYTYDPKNSLVKELMVKFNLPKNFEIEEESVKEEITGTPVPKDCKIFNPSIINNTNQKTIIWRIRNVNPKRRYTLYWKRKN